MTACWGTVFRSGIKGINFNTFATTNSEIHRLKFIQKSPKSCSVHCALVTPLQTQVVMEREVDIVKLMHELREEFCTGRTRPLDWRKNQLKALLCMVQEHEADISQALYEDIGKPPFETYIAELSLISQSCKTALKQLKSWMTPKKVSTSIVSFPSSGEIVPEPLGVTLVISAWNFPFLLSLDPVIGAIAAGNAVVLKPSELAPATSAVLARLIPRYLDNKALRVVEGGIPVTTALLEQQWDKIFYTGSTRVGRIVMSAAAKHLTPVVLELGGKSPVLIDSTVDLKIATRRIAFGKWANNNAQACISPDYILAEKSVVPNLVRCLKKCLRNFYGEDPKESKEIARIVNSAHFSRLSALLDEKNIKETILLGGQRDPDKLYIAPTIILDPPMDSSVMTEEIFGPILPIITVESMDSAIQIVNSRPKPLALYLFTRDKATEKKVINRTSAGGMVVNDTLLHFTNNAMPFGGVGESGMGAYHGKFSFEAFSHMKPVLHRSMLMDMSARYPPYDAKKKNFVRSLLEGDCFGVLKALFTT